MAPISSLESGLEVFMTVSIWSKTPDHLLERIWAFLSVEELLRLRSVCKRWSCDILTVPMLRKLHREFSPRQQPWFLVSSTKRSFSAYDVNTHKWNNLYVSKLPDPDLKVVASSQGLLCYGLSSDDITTDHVYVCNPITGEWRHLPQHPEKTVDHFGMKYDAKRNSYKIMTMNVTSCTMVVRRVTIYDSRLNKWTEAPVPNRSMQFNKGSSSTSPMVWCGDRVYFMDRIRPFCELHAFNTKLFLWYELHSAPSTPGQCFYPSLVACKDRIFMVALCSHGCKMWEVVDQQPVVQFMEYDTLPTQLPNEFAVKKKPSDGAGRCANYNPFRLSAVGSNNNLMCFSSNLDHTWVLLYNTDTKTFHESPKDTHPVQICEYVYLPFQPCLDASP